MFVTGDRTLSYEHNLTNRRLAIVSLSAIEWRLVKNHLPRISSAIAKSVAGSFQTIDCGVFNRKKPGGTEDN